MGGMSRGYRSDGAKRIHDALMRYVKNSGVASTVEFEDALSAATDAEVTELSKNQDSVLQDILHLPEAIISEQDLANKEEIIQSKTSSLLNCLWNRIKDNDQLVEFLCTSKNSAGFTPLHDALTGNSANLSLYLKLLRACDPELQTQVLTSANAAGFTPLHQALKAGNPENVRLYLNRIQDLLDKNTLRRLLYAKNRSGYTSMHQASGSKNAVAISKILIGFVKRNFYEDDANEIIQYLLYTRIKNYLPSANKKTHGNKLANEIDTCLRDLRRQYPERDGYTDTNRSQSSSGDGKRRPRRDDYRSSSNRTAYASGPDQGRSGKGNYNNYGNSSSFFRSSPQARLGAGGASASQPSNNGKRSSDDYNDYTHDHRNNKSYRR